jgi:hypothetical protein
MNKMLDDGSLELCQHGVYIGIGFDEAAAFAIRAISIRDVL